MLEELADAQAAAASSMSELAELRRQNKELQKQVTVWIASLNWPLQQLLLHLQWLWKQMCLSIGLLTRAARRLQNQVRPLADEGGSEVL